MKITLKSILTCPNCNSKTEEDMPLDSCEYFYECSQCKMVIKPKHGDCCVYCSYGTIPCPPIQKNNSNCC